MRMTRWHHLLTLLVWSSSLSSASAQDLADLVLRSGKLITVDAENRLATAVALIGDRIVAVGDDEAIAAFIGPETEVLDLAGRAVVPGFIDAHSHVEGLAESENARVPIHIPHSVATPEEIVERLRQRARTLPPGSWIVGQGTYNQVMPTREALDDALPDHPVVLRWSGHDLLINHKAVEVAKLERIPDPTGIGRIERTADGEPAILRDAHVELPLPTPTLEDKKRWIPETLREFYLERGVTTVYDMSSPETFALYQDLKDRGTLPVRLSLTYQARDLESLIAVGLRTGFGDDWLRVGGIKFYMDGVWGTTAATYRPAWKGSGTTWIPNNTGGIRVDQETFNREVLRAHEAGFQIWTHANGDRGADIVLNAYEAAQRALPRPDARHRIEHFGNFLVQDAERTAERLARLKRGGVIAAPQIAFLWRLTDLGVEEPGVKFVPMASLVKEGFKPPGSSDTLGTQNFATNPWFSISVAVNRRTKHGTFAYPEEALTVMDAIRSHTIWAAYSGFEENVKGSIEVGKLADLVVLSADPLTVEPAALMDIVSEIVVLDGRIAHRR